MKLKKYRTQMYTQKEMATALNLSERQYRRIEKGTSLPNILTAMQIADMLNVYDLREIWDSTWKNESMKTNEEIAKTAGLKISNQQI